MEKVTVLLQVKNGAEHIRACMESILNQTYRNFKLIIIDDQSEDHTLSILASYNDERITIIQGQSGYINNLNYGISICDTVYIARMDADDIMLPFRLERQLQVMEHHYVDLCGTWMQVFGDQDYLAGDVSGLIDNAIDKLYKVNFLFHPTMMIRKDFLLKHQLQYEHYFPTEDYKLWSEIAKKNGKIYVIPEPLLKYRRSNSQLSIANHHDMRRQELRIRSEIGEFLRRR
jgi:glycosyltransferase involved in cell wall biosynthesis